MSLELFQTVELIETMENFIEKIRPEESIRPELDITYTIKEQSVFINELRPSFFDPSIKREFPFAKTTFVKTKNIWKIFWLRANGNWDPYSPNPTVKTLKEFTIIVAEDKHHCFFG